jgi:hypothetical protein
MKTKRQQQKIPITKKSDLDLNVFLHSITHLSIGDTNKHFIFNLDDTNNVMFSLTDFLDFDPIKNYFYKLYVLSCMNGTILDITFKFMAGLNMQLIFGYFYAPRKKRQLFTYFDLMCGQDLPVSYNIELSYIDFSFSFIFSFFFTILNFLFFYFFSFYHFILISWDLGFFFYYISIM